MRGGRAPVERPSDEQLGVEVAAREPLSDRVERLRLRDGRSAVLKIGGFWSLDAERLLYEQLLRPDPDSSPALIGSSVSWLLLEDVGAQSLHLADADAAYERLGAMHRAHVGISHDGALGEALAAGPLSAPDARSMRSAADELVALVERAVADRETWEVGQPEREAAEQLRAWADRAGPALAASGPVTLLHGDFQKGNWLRDVDGAVRLVDWELAGLGPGILDLCFLDPDGPGAGHAPAGEAALRALEAYGSVNLDALRHAVVWGRLAGARLRLADYYAERARSRTQRSELPAAAATLLRGAAERARRA